MARAAPPKDGLSGCKKSEDESPAPAESVLGALMRSLKFEGGGTPGNCAQFARHHDPFRLGNATTEFAAHEGRSTTPRGS